MVGKNLELMASLPDPPTPDAAKGTLGVIGNLCSATAAAGKKSGGAEAGSGERRLSEAGSGSGEYGSGSGEAPAPPPRSKESLQFEKLRAGISALGDATLKGSPHPHLHPSSHLDPNPSPNARPHPNPGPNQAGWTARSPSPW